MTADPLSRLLLEHETWLTVERGLAKNSLAAYRRDLRRYEHYLRRIGVTDAHAVAEGTVSAYVEELKRARTDVGTPQFAPSSIARALVAVRSFHRFSVDEGFLDLDPSEDVGAPRVPQGLPKALTEPEVDALLDAVEGDGPRALRDRAILETLYATGVRISELVGLDREDLDLEDGLIRVLGKGSKERVVPVGRSARRSITDYLMRGRSTLERPATRQVAGDPLLLNARGGRLSRQSCWKIVTTAGERVGIEPGKLSPHVLRHSCATHMLEHGADIRSTTQVYTKVSPERLRAVYELAHPRARIGGGPR